MKLRLPQTLVVLAVASLTSAHAATIGSGVSYDNGKGSEPYSKDPDAHILPGAVKTDTLYCWAASASNMIQYWQDTYGKDYLVNDVPTGYNITVYDQPDGTRYLNVYEYFLANGLVDGGGTQNEAINWYFRQSPKADGLKANAQHFMCEGTGAPDLITKDYSGGLYLYETPSAALADLTSTLENVFSTQGQSIGLAIWQQDPEDAGREWEDLQSRSHAVTCWGYEKNADGVVNALYLSDSDDMEYGVFKVHLTIGQSVPIGGMPSWDAIIMQTDDQIDGYGGYVVNLKDLYAISPNSTPDSEEGVTQYYKDYAKEATPLPTLSSAQDAQTVEVIETNTIISDSVQRSGAGVKVGKDVAQGAPSIVMLVSETPDSALTLTGNGNGTGLDVTHGSMASVANLSVSGYERGVNAEGKVYLYGDEVNVKNNTLPSGDGAGIHNTNYVEIKDAGTVNITGNKATNGNGGGIYNQDVVSITNNATVFFSDNQAIQGNDIYNAKGGSVNIADNASVEFVGELGANSVAIVNNGDLYLKSGKDSEGLAGSIQFSYASLNSSGGTTYVGLDMKGGTAETLIYFSDGDVDAAAFMQLSSNPESADAVTILDHVTVSPYEIVGAGAGTSSLKNANIFVANDFTLSKLTVDSTDTFTGYEANLVLDNLVISLAGLQLEDNVLDISNMFASFVEMTIDNVYLDASSLNLYEGWNDESSVTVKFGDSLKKEDLDAGTKLTVLLGNNMMTTQRVYATGGNVTFKGSAIIPEPATGTLSLLALAGLAARRRRK